MEYRDVNTGVIKPSFSIYVNLQVFRLINDDEKLNRQPTVRAIMNSTYGNVFLHQSKRQISIELLHLNVLIRKIWVLGNSVENEDSRKGDCESNLTQADLILFN